MSHASSPGRCCWPLSLMRCGGPSAVRTRTAAKRASSFPLVPFRQLRVCHLASASMSSAGIDRISGMCRLRLVDSLLPAFTLLLLGGLFPPCRRVGREPSSPYGLSTCGRLSSVSRRRPDWWVVRHARRRVRRIRRAPENDARLRHGRGDDVRIVAFLRRALVKEIAVGAPRFQSRLHRRRGDRQIEEAQRSLVGLQFSRHRRFPARPANATASVVYLPCEQRVCEASEQRGRSGIYLDASGLS